MADHIFDPTIVHELIKTKLLKESVVLCVDNKTEANPCIDLDDVTKVKTKNNSKSLIDPTESNDYYFVHSYFFDCDNVKNILGTTFYGIDFASIVSKENIYGVQFHPEKSSNQGLNLIKNFIQI